MRRLLQRRGDRRADARFARPQLALGAGARRRSSSAALAAVVAAGRPRRARGGRGAAPVRAGGGGSPAAGADRRRCRCRRCRSRRVARRRAIAVGLVTQSWRGWAVDLAKATAIEARRWRGAGGGGGRAVTRRYPRGWWLPAAGGSVAFGALLAALAPVVLDPVFNDFTPLPEGETRVGRARARARRRGQGAGRSTRSTRAAARPPPTPTSPASGPTKRVVLFDTLLDRYSRDEVRVVVAHELAHVRHRDVPRGVALRGDRRAGGGAGRAAAELGAVRPSAGRRRRCPALALAAALVTRAARARSATGCRGRSSAAPTRSRSSSRAPRRRSSRSSARSRSRTSPTWSRRAGCSTLLATHPPTARADRRRGRLRQQTVRAARARRRYSSTRRCSLGSTRRTRAGS